MPPSGLDDEGNAIEISKPPGKTKRMKSGATLEVGDNFFKRNNVSVEKGARLEWRFESNGLHNVTLANGPEAIGSPNLNEMAGEPRTFSRRFDRLGTYRLFRGLHPVQMTERVVVKK